jgi:phosphatidate cytidylyltransferase
MNNLLVRTLSGIFFVVIVVGALLWGLLPSVVLLGIFMIVGLTEFYELFQRDTSGSSHKFVGVFFGLLIYVGVAGKQLEWWSIDTLFYLVPIFFLPFLGMLFSKQKEPIKTIALHYLSWIYVVLPFLLMIQIYSFGGPDDSWTYIIGLFVVVWSNDSFAYLTGRAFGKTKLFERISPKKTWEGTIGGAVMAILVSIIYAHFVNQNYLFWAISALLIAPAAVLGDLIESKIKRTAGVKDSGSIMPGHGGVLDRFDAVLFATPFFFLWISIAVTELNFL